jgi:hypothetical protein
VSGRGTIGDSIENSVEIWEGILARAIRSHQLWLTVGYVTILLLLARAYA